MRLDTLKVGDPVIIGNRKQVQEGRGGTVAYFLAAGKYTEVHNPCGPGVVLNPKKRDRVAVLAIPRVTKYERKNGDYKELAKPLVTWEPRTVSAVSVFDPADFWVKHNRLLKLQRERERWERERKRVRDVRDEALQLLIKHAGFKSGIELGHGRYNRRVGRYEYTWASVELDDLVAVLLARPYCAKLVQRYRIAQHALVDWEARNPDPTICKVD